MKDYYRILGVNENATLDEIKTAFRELSKKYHPDNFVNADEITKKNAENKFKEISEAYNNIIGKSKGRDSFSDSSSSENVQDNVFKEYFKKQFEDELDIFFNDFSNSMNNFFNSFNFANEKAYDEFQKFYSDIKKDMEKNQIQISLDLSYYINPQNRGKISREEFEKTSKLLKNIIECQKLKKYYFNKKQEAAAKGIILSAGDVLLNNTKIKSSDLSKLKAEIEKEISLKEMQYESSKNLKIYIQVVEMISMRFHQSLIDIKNFNANNFLSNKEKINKQINDLIEKRKKSIFKNMENFEKKYKILKKIDISYDEITESELNLIVKIIAAYSNNINIFNSHKQINLMVNVIEEQLKIYKKETAEVLKEIQELCKIHNINLDLSTVFKFKKLDYYLSLDELQYIKDMIIREYSFYYDNNEDSNYKRA